MKILLLLVPCLCAHATVFGSIRGVVHDPHHRPMAGARVTIRAAEADYAVVLTTAQDGTFEAVSTPAGAYQRKPKVTGRYSVSPPTWLPMKMRS